MLSNHNIFLIFVSYPFFLFNTKQSATDMPH